MQQYDGKELEKIALVEQVRLRNVTFIVLYIHQHHTRRIWLQTRALVVSTSMPKKFGMRCLTYCVMSLWGTSRRTEINITARSLKHLSPSLPDKLRLVLIYIASQEDVSKGDKEKLFEAAGFTREEQLVIENAAAIGVTLDKVLSRNHTDAFADNCCL